MSDYIEKDASGDGIDRRGFLKCMAWAGAGMVWVSKGGIPRSTALGAAMGGMGDADFTFGQASHRHLGFNKGVFTGMLRTFPTARARVNSLPSAPPPRV